MFRILTDSAANLPEELVRQYDLGIVHIGCYVDGQELDFSRGFDGKKYYDDMRGGMRVSTSMPCFTAFSEAFSAPLLRGEDVLYIGMSGGISGTAALAASVARELQEEHPERRIVTIDTRAASLGEGIPVLYAAKLLRKGLNLEEVAARTVAYCDNVWQVFTVDDLSYLRKTGRLFSAAVKVTNSLHVKPILVGDEEGHIVLRRVTVGRRRSLDALAARYRDKCSDMTKPVGLAHADSPEDTQYVIDKLREYGCTGEIMNVVYEPVTGSHVGPGTVALFFYGSGRP